MWNWGTAGGKHHGHIRQILPMLKKPTSSGQFTTWTSRTQSVALMPQLSLPTSGENSLVADISTSEQLSKITTPSFPNTQIPLRLGRVQNSHSAMQPLQKDNKSIIKETGSLLSRNTGQQSSGLSPITGVS